MSGKEWLTALEEHWDDPSSLRPLALVLGMVFAFLSLSIAMLQTHLLRRPFDIVGVSALVAFVICSSCAVGAVFSGRYRRAKVIRRLLERPEDVVWIFLSKSAEFEPIWNRDLTHEFAAFFGFIDGEGHFFGLDDSEAFHRHRVFLESHFSHATIGFSHKRSSIFSKNPHALRKP